MYKNIFVVISICCILLVLGGCSGTAGAGNNEGIDQGGVQINNKQKIKGKGVKTVRSKSHPAGRYMLPEDFSSSLRKGATVVYFAKIACPSCEKQDVIWKKVINNLPAGAQAEKRFSYGIDPRKYGIHQLPTLIFYKNGLEVKRFIGVMQEGEIYRNLNRAL